MSQIAQNLEEVRRRMAATARRAGRDPAAGAPGGGEQDGAGGAGLKQAVATGQRLFGENYLQEARGKIEALGEAASWHFIGHLQSNKAKAAVGLFELIHGVDRLKLAEAPEFCRGLQRNLTKNPPAGKPGGRGLEIRDQPRRQPRSCCGRSASCRTCGWWA